MPAAIRIARASAIALFGIPLVLLTYATLLGAYGRAAAVTGAALIALSPNMIAHAALATTDVCFVLTALMALYALILLHGRSNARSPRLAGCGAEPCPCREVPGRGAVCGDGHCSVLSRIVNAPGVPADCAFRTGDVRSCGHCRRGGVGVTCLHACATHESAARLRSATCGNRGSHLDQARHQRAGHPAFLMGDRSIVGWWYYMPIALALKSTPSELVIMAYGLWACVTGWRRASAPTLVWRVAMITFAALAIVNRLALGVRYVLLVLPLLPLDRVRSLASAYRGSPAMVSGRRASPSVVAPAVSAATIAPHYLSYFNRLSGGPETGYHYLADSNIDWGQDLPALRKTLVRVGAKRSLVWSLGALRSTGTASPPTSGTATSSLDFTRWDWVALRLRISTASTCRTTSFSRSAPSRRRRDPDTRYSCLRQVNRSALRDGQRGRTLARRRVKNEACHHPEV